MTPFARVYLSAALLAANILFVSPVWASEEIKLLVLGDSLTAGYGLPPGEAFPVKLEAALKARGHAVQVINAGVSGDTSAGGLARLDWVLGDKPQAAIVELGANDALRGLDPQKMRGNLENILARLEHDKIPTLFAGMKAPPNLGADYTQQYSKAFDELAAAHKVLYYPFFLDGVAAHQELNQADGLHPSPAGVAIIVQSILPKVEELLQRVEAHGT
jgi:acyl-CoA thioesterase-1